jgi:hypothetical protein
MNTGSYESGGAVPWGQSRGSGSGSGSPVYSQPPAYASSDSVQLGGGREGGYAEEPAVVSTAPLLLSVSTSFFLVSDVAC